MFAAYTPPECKKAREFHGLFYILAEKEGFEPSIRRTVYRISSPAHSTTLPPLLVFRRRLAPLADRSPRLYLKSREIPVIRRVLRHLQ